MIKKRSGAHQRTIRELTLGGGGISLGEPLSDLHGVMTGLPTDVGSAEALAADGS